MSLADRLTAFFQVPGRKAHAIAAAVLLAAAGAAYLHHAFEVDHRARMDLAEEIILGVAEAQVRDRERWGSQDPEVLEAIGRAAVGLRAFTSFRPHFAPWVGGRIVVPPLTEKMRALVVNRAEVLDEVGRALLSEDLQVPARRGIPVMLNPEDVDAVLGGLLAQGSAALEDRDLEGAFLAVRRMSALGRVLRRSAGQGSFRIWTVIRIRGAVRSFLVDMAHVGRVPPGLPAIWTAWYEAEARWEADRGSILEPLRWSRDEELARSFEGFPEDIYTFKPRTALQRLEHLLHGRRVPSHVRILERPPPPLAAVERARNLARRIDAAWDARDAAALAPEGELGVLAREGGIDGYSPASLGVDPDLGLVAWREDVWTLLVRIHLRLRALDAEGTLPASADSLPADLPVDPWRGKRPEIHLRKDGWLLRGGPAGTVEFEGDTRTWEPATLEYVRPAK